MIEALKYMLLGLIQGLTETIPVSSSGHLMIFKSLINLDVDFETIAVVTNFGSLIAIIVLFWDDIKKLFFGFVRYLKKHDKKDRVSYYYCWLVVVGCIPAGIMGLIVSKLELFDKIENNIKVVGLMLIITSVLLFLIRNFKGHKEDRNLSFKDALTVGCFQILGLLPGISRSGSTIVGGMFSGLKRDTAFKFSFMLYIPMSLAAMLLDITKVTVTGSLAIYYLLAALVAFIATYLVTKWFRKIVNEGKLIYFSIYCLIVGLLVLLFLK